MARDQQNERGAPPERVINLFGPVRTTPYAAIIPSLEVVVCHSDLQMALYKFEPLPVLMAVTDKDYRFGRCGGHEEKPRIKPILNPSTAHVCILRRCCSSPSSWTAASVRTEGCDGAAPMISSVLATHYFSKNWGSPGDFQLAKPTRLHPRDRAGSSCGLARLP
jgi:hypothetical protein